MTRKRQSKIERVIIYPTTIGSLSKFADCSLDMIRYYEDIGLLQNVTRSPGGHRLYKRKHYERLIFIRKCRSLEFSLNEIDCLLNIIDKDDIQCNKIEQIIMLHLSDIRKRIIQLCRIERKLEKLTSDCTPWSSDCAAIKALMEDIRLQIVSKRRLN